MRFLNNLLLTMLSFTVALPAFSSAEEETQILLAESKSKKKSKKKTTTKKEESSKPKSTKKSVDKKAQPSVQAGAGVITGIKKPDSKTGFVFTGDYKSPINDRLTWQAGALFWRYDIIQDLYASANYLMTFGGGAGYMIPFGSSVWMETGAHLYFAKFTMDYVYDVEGEPVNETASKTGLGLSLHASMHFSVGAFNFGPEIRLPFILNKEISEYSANYILFFAEMEF